MKDLLKENFSGTMIGGVVSGTGFHDNISLANIVKEKYGEVELHLVGSLQTNKVKEAMKNFQVIHSIDREKLVLKIESEAQRLGNCPELFIQVNTGNEIQKAGVSLEKLEDLFKLAKDIYSLP